MEGNTPPNIKNLKSNAMDEDVEEEEIVFNENMQVEGDDEKSINSGKSGSNDNDSMTDDIKNAEKDIRGAMEGNNTTGGNKDDDMEDNMEEDNEGEGNAINLTSKMGGANTASWTPLNPNDNNNNSKGKGNSGTGGKSKTTKNSRASFSSDTSTKTSGKVGSNVRRQQKRTSGGQKKIDHAHKFFVEMSFRVQKGAPGTLHQSIIDVMGDTLTILRDKDDEVAILNASDETTPAFTKTQLPKLSTFADEWVHFVGDVNKLFKDNIPNGKARTYNAVLMIGSQWDPTKLLEKTVIDLQSINVDLTYKKVQELHTERFIAILGAYNNLDEQGVKHIVHEMLVEGANMMLADKTEHYTPLIWGPEHIPDFEIWRGYIKNAPWVERAKDEKTSSWQKMALHLEYKPADEELLFKRMVYAKKKGLVKKYLGRFAYPIMTPKQQLPERERSKFSTMVNRHGSVNLSMGIVKVRGVIEPDTPVEIHRAQDYHGNERVPISISFRDLLMSIKENGVRLFHCLNQAKSGDYELVYPAGKGCDNHKIAAQGWGDLPGGHLKFYLLKRGCEPADVDKLISTIFDSEEIVSAEGCKLLEDGTIINKAEGEVRDEIAEVDACPYVDIREGLLKSELREMDKGVARTRGPAIDPKSMAAFNFNKEDHTVKDYRDRADDDTIKTNDYSGVSLGENTEYAMPNDDYLTTAPSVANSSDPGKQPPKPKGYDWENLLDDEDEDGEDEVVYAGTKPASAAEDNGGGTTNPNTTGSNVSEGAGATASDELEDKERTIAAMAERMAALEAMIQQMEGRSYSNISPPASASATSSDNPGLSQPKSDEDDRTSALGSATGAQEKGQEGGASARSGHNPG